MDDTTLVTDEQICLVASKIPCNLVTHLARAYLCLCDEDIISASGRLSYTLYDVVYDGWKTWVNSKPGSRTVQHAKELLQEASHDGVDTREALSQLDMHKDTDYLDNVILSKLSCQFSEHSWEIFSQQYLHISPPALADGLLPTADSDPYRITVAILTKWRNKIGSTATVKHLIDVLNVAVDDGCIGQEVTAVLYDAHSPLRLPDKYAALVSKLRILYQTEDYSKMSPLRWDAHGPAYSIKDMYIPLTCKRHDSASKHTSLRMVDKAVSMSNILDVLDPSRSSDNRHVILIEGQPGSGKTTLCKKLAYDWARGVKEGKGLSTYSAVFCINLILLKKDQSIADYIATEMLQDPSSKDTVENVLLTTKILIILDGLDEMKTNNEEVNKLLSGKLLYINWHVVVTYLTETRRQYMYPYNVLYRIENLSDEQIVQLSQKHCSKQSSIFTYDNVKFHPLRSFATTPLYLALTCMLYDKLSVALESSVFETFNVFVNEMYTIAEESVTQSEDLLATPDKFSEAYEGLSAMAYKAMCEDSSRTLRELSSVQQRLGFTKTYYNTTGSKLVQYNLFLHKKILEYMTAQHIVQATRRKRTTQRYVDHSNNPVVAMLLRIAKVKVTNRRASTLVVHFVLGLLAKEVRTDDVEAVLKHLVFQKRFLNSEGHLQYHYGLSCLAQIGEPISVTIPHKSVGRSVRLDTNCRGFDCVQGTLAYLKLGGAEIEKILINRPFLQLTSKSNDGETVLANILRHGWGCKKVAIHNLSLCTLIEAWQKCSDEEKMRVEWQQIVLKNCTGTDEQRQRIGMLLPETVAIWKHELLPKMKSGNITPTESKAKKYNGIVQEGESSSEDSVTLLEKQASFQKNIQSLEKEMQSLKLEKNVLTSKEDESGVTIHDRFLKNFNAFLDLDLDIVDDLLQAGILSFDRYMHIVDKGKSLTINDRIKEMLTLVQGSEENVQILYDVLRARTDARSIELAALLEPTYKEQQTHTEDLLRAAGIPRSAIADVAKIAENIPPYLAGRFATHCGMDTWQWQHIIGLAEHGSPRLRAVLNRIKKCESSADAATLQPITLIIKPLLQDMDPNQSWWSQVLQIIDDKAWVEISGNLTEEGFESDEKYATQSESDDPDTFHIYGASDSVNKGREYYIRHLTRTLLEIICHNKPDAKEYIEAAATETLPMFHRNEIKKILGVNIPTESNKPHDTQQRISMQTNSYQSEYVRVEQHCASIDMTPFSDVYGSAPSSMQRIEHSLKLTEATDRRDFSLFGGHGYEKYEILFDYVRKNQKIEEWRPIGIAVIDSGCAQFLMNMREIECGGYTNYIGTEETTLDDSEGHGTLVSEIIHRYCGFAKIRLFHYRVMKKNMSATHNDVIDALRRIHEKDDIDIINMSLQTSTFSTEFKDLLDEVGRSKIIICAAGNDFFGGVQCVYPAQNAMVIPVDGKNLTISADATKPFVHITCPAESCDAQRVPATSFAAPHATALAAILLRIADIMDQQALEDLQHNGIRDNLLVRVAYGWPWGPEFPLVMKDLLGSDYDTKADRILKVKTEEEVFFAKLTEYTEKELDYYGLRQSLTRILETDDHEKALSSMMTSKEMCWYVANHVKGINKLFFAQNIIEDLKKRCRHGGYFKATCNMDASSMTEYKGNEEAGSNYLHMLRLLVYYKQNNPDLTAMEFLKHLQDVLKEHDFHETAKRLESIIKGPLRRQLLTCTEHMRSMFIRVKSAHNTLQGYSSGSHDGLYNVVSYVLNTYKEQIQNIVRNNYYPVEIAKLNPSFAARAEVEDAASASTSNTEGLNSPNNSKNSNNNESNTNNNNNNESSTISAVLDSHAG